MSKQYTAAQRLAAAEALAIVASSITPTTMGAYENDRNSDEECEEIYDKDGQPYAETELIDLFDGDGEDPVFQLAEGAYLAVPSYRGGGEEVPIAQQYAEAESWVRSGWSDFGDQGLFK